MLFQRQAIFSLSVGVNETQAVANAAGNTDTQSQVNRAAVTELRTYHSDLMKCNNRPFSGGARAAHSERLAEAAAALQATRVVPGLLDELDRMVEAEAREERSYSKNVDLLLTSCLIARLLNGVRTISCKSATDRTAMFQTLETARFAERSGMIHRCVVLLLFIHGSFTKGRPKPSSPALLTEPVFICGLLGTKFSSCWTHFGENKGCD